MLKPQRSDDREVLERMQRALALTAAWCQQDKTAIRIALVPYGRDMAHALVEASHDMALLTGYLLASLRDDADVDAALAALGHQIAEAIP